MNRLAQFKAVYCPGLFIPNDATASALALLFEKVYLPNNINIVREFSKRYRIKGLLPEAVLEAMDLSMKSHLQNAFPDNEIEVYSFYPENEIFEDLSEDEKNTALQYLIWATRFRLRYGILFGDVFETDFFGKAGPVSPSDLLLETPELGKTSDGRVAVTVKTKLGELSREDTTLIFPQLVSQGYIPVVSNHHTPGMSSQHLDEFSAKQLAALLAMKSVEMIIPRTKPAEAEVILEARDRLSNHLPPFWSSMLKLTTELKTRIDESPTAEEVFRESQDLVDTTVRPALIDLQEKLEKERKDWFYKILSAVSPGVKLLIGNPPLTQQQLLTNALLLGADVTVSAVENARTIDALKREAGLTFLLKANEHFEKG